MRYELLNESIDHARAKIAGWINAATSALVAISRRWPMPPNSPQLAKQLKTRNILTAAG
jgi:hypothetical protein